MWEEGVEMNRLIIILFFFVSFVISGSCYAESIAIEMRENNKFVDIIGKAFITEDSIEIVTFAKVEGLPEVIAPYAFIYKILERSSREADVYHIKCQNQLGVIFSGTIDLKDPLNPKILLISDRGLVMTNISNDGLNMKQKYLQYLYLGK